MPDGICMRAMDILTRCGFMLCSNAGLQFNKFLRLDQCNILPS